MKLTLCRRNTLIKCTPSGQSIDCIVCFMIPCKARKKNSRRSSFLVSEVRLECVVEFDAEGIVRIAEVIFVFRFAAEVVVCIEFDVLLQCYTSFCLPELQAGQHGVIQVIGHIPCGNTAEVSQTVSIYIVNAERPRTYFVSIHFTVSQTCGPHSCFISQVVCMFDVIAIENESATERLV